MPWVTVETSLSQDQLGEDFGPGLTKLLSSALNKAENMVLISFVTDRRMMCAGKEASIMNLFLTATAVLGNPEKNIGYSRQITDFVCAKTGLKEDQVFILFSPIEHWQVGINGGILPP